MTEEQTAPSGSLAETTSSVPPITTPTLEVPAVPAASPEAPAFVPLDATAIALPEGFTLDEPVMNDFLGIMNNQEMSPSDRAQALVNLQASLATKASEAGSQAWNDQQAAWQADVAADPEIGGANLDKTIANIGNLMTRFGNDEVRAAFDRTGAGNNPAVVKFLNALSTQLKEPGPVNPGGPAGGSAPRSQADRIFGGN